jgi:hypothetical protein
MEQSNHSFRILASGEDYDVIPGAYPTDPTFQIFDEFSRTITTDVLEQMFHNSSPPPMPWLSSDASVGTDSSGVIYDPATFVTDEPSNELKGAMPQVR